MKFRIIPALEKNPTIVKFCQTTAGKAVLVLSFCAILYLLRYPGWFELIASMLLMHIFKNRDQRYALIGYAVLMSLFSNRFATHEILLTEYHVASDAYYIFTRSMPWTQWLMSIAAVINILFLLGVYLLAFRIRFLRTSPFTSVLSITLFLMVIAVLLPATGIVNQLAIYTIITFVRKFHWVMIYSLMHQKYLRSESPILAIAPGIIHRIPYGKSNAYLKMVEAKDAETFAVCQIKAVKLLLWSLILSAVMYAFGPLMGYPGFEFAERWLEPYRIHSLTEQIWLFLHQQADSNLAVWRTLLLTFVYDLLWWTTTVNAPIAVIRLFGFNLPRGVYRPLEARSIADFFGRRYYFLKEVIFDIYVFPLIQEFRTVRDRKWRVFLAIWIGVAFATASRHLMLDFFLIRKLGLMEFLWRYSPFLLRCSIFGILVGMSQFRQTPKSADQPLLSLRNALSLTVIVLVFSLSKIFTPMMLQDNPGDVYAFFFSLFRGWG